MYVIFTLECSDPPVPAFGSVSVETFARYECSAGFKVDGPYERSCKPGEDWSPEAPVCKLSESTIAACYTISGLFK